MTCEYPWSSAHLTLNGGSLWSISTNKHMSNYNLMAGVCLSGLSSKTISSLVWLARSVLRFTGFLPFRLIVSRPAGTAQDYLNRQRWTLPRMQHHSPVLVGYSWNVPVVLKIFTRPFDFWQVHTIQLFGKLNTQRFLSNNSYSQWLRKTTVVSMAR